MTDVNVMGLMFEMVGIFGLSFLFCLQRITHQSEYELTFWSNATVSLSFLFSAAFQTHLSLELNYKSITYIIVCAVVMFIGTVLSFAGWKQTEPFISSMIAQSNLAFTFVMSCFVGLETEVGVDKFLGLVLIFSSVLFYLILTKNDEVCEVEVGPITSHLLGLEHSKKHLYFDEEL